MTNFSRMVESISGRGRTSDSWGGGNFDLGLDIYQNTFFTNVTSTIIMHSFSACSTYASASSSEGVPEARVGTGKAANAVEDGTTYVYVILLK